MKIQFDNPAELTELDRAHAVAAQMVKHGRGFTKSLGVRLAKTDLDGVRKFKKKFSVYYRKYAEILDGD